LKFQTSLGATPDKDTLVSEVQPSESIEHVCRIGDSASLDTIPAYCETLVGRLTIDHRSLNADLWKLYNVTNIFGNLIIRNSSWEGFSPLWKLREITNLEAYESALVVKSNERLKSIFMKDFSRISSDLPIRIENNQHLEMSSEECEKYQIYAHSDFRENKLDCSTVHIVRRTENNNLILFSSEDDVRQYWSGLRVHPIASILFLYTTFVNYARHRSNKYSIFRIS
ncbi:receptor L domain protein, partial [Ancylostoma caninum]